MRHDLLPTARATGITAPATTLHAPGMREAPRATALIAPPGLALCLAPRLLAASRSAIALTAVAAAAHQHLDVTARAYEQACARHPGHRPGHRLRSRHRHSRACLLSALPGPPQSLQCNGWTRSGAGAILRSHSWLTRWGAAARITARSLRLPRPFQQHRAVLPRPRLIAQPRAPGRLQHCSRISRQVPHHQARRAHGAAPEHAARSADPGRWGVTPSTSLRHS